MVTTIVIIKKTVLFYKLLVRCQVFYKCVVIRVGKMNVYINENITI